MGMEAPKGSLRLASFGASFSADAFGFGEPLGLIALGFEGTRALGRTLRTKRQNWVLQQQQSKVTKNARFEGDETEAQDNPCVLPCWFATYTSLAKKSPGTL